MKQRFYTKVLIMLIGFVPNLFSQVTYESPAMYETDFTSYTESFLSANADWTAANNLNGWAIAAGAVSQASNYRGDNLTASSAILSSWSVGQHVRYTVDIDAEIPIEGKGEYWLGITGVTGGVKNTNDKFVGVSFKITTTALLIKAGDLGNTMFTYSANKAFQLVVEIEKSTTSGEFNLSVTVDGGTPVTETITQADVYSGSGLEFTAYMKNANAPFTFTSLKLEKEELGITPLTVNAGADQEVNDGNLVQLSGSSSYDSDVDYTKTYEWTAPAGITLSATNIANPTFTAPAADRITSYELTFKTTVSPDVDGVTEVTDNVVVTVVPSGGLYASGSGTDVDPYVLSNSDHIYNLSMTNDQGDWAKYYVLSADINMDGTTLTHPIGMAGAEFSGEFDGANYVISNLTIDVDGDYGQNDGIGLIGSLTGKIMNLGIKNISIDEAGMNRIGAIAGQMGGDSEISNCFAIGGSINNGYSGWAGSITGVTFSATSVLRDCFASVKISSGWGNAGIIGSVRQDGSVVDNVVYYGDAGNDPAITFVFTHTDPAKGVKNGGSDITNSYFLKGISGNNDVGDSLTIAEARDQANYAGLDFTTTPVWAMATNGFAVLNSFGTKASELSVTSSKSVGWVNGTVSPLGAQTVGFGAEVTYSFVPNADHGATNLWVNGEQVEYWDTPATSYTFDAVTENSTLEVMFQNLVVTGTEKEQLEELKVYGAINAIVIENNNSFNYKLYNLSGKQISAGLVNSNRTELKVPMRGIYIISIQDETGITTKKVLVQ